MLGLNSAKPIFETLELLNKTLLSRHINFKSIKENVELVKKEIRDLRCEEVFKDL